MKPRIACVILPRFSVEVCMRTRPSLAGRPLAIAEGDSRREVVAASRDALGVSIGMTPKQARAACPGLVVLARDHTAELAATRGLLDALETCGPDVEGAAPGLCYFDATLLPAGETQALGAAIALVAALGFACAAAVADDKFTAKCAALVAGGGVSIVPAGGSAAFLAPLPAALLPLAPGDGDRFDLLGLRTLGQIAALPTGPLARRFGERARDYARSARGEDEEPLHPRRETAVYEERFAFDGAVDNREPVLFALRGCIAAVAARLAGCAQTCDRADVVLESDATCRAGSLDPAISIIPVLLAEPTASADTIFHLARIALESREMLESVAAIAVRVAPCGQAPPQLSLFDGSASSRRAALAATLARLRAALDPRDVVMLTPTPARSRLPERMQQATPIASPRDLCDMRDPCGMRDFSRAAGLKSGIPQNKPWAPALRLVDPPKPMHAPAQTAWCAGPFRLSEGWWERPVERDYYQMTDPAGALLLVFRDARDGNWYLQGVFD
jgi:protein ImuB